MTFPSPYNLLFHGHLQELNQEKAKSVDKANGKPCNRSFICKRNKMSRLARKKTKRQGFNREREGVGLDNSSFVTENQQE